MEFYWLNTSCLASTMLGSKFIMIYCESSSGSHTNEQKGKYINVNKCDPVKLIHLKFSKDIIGAWGTDSFCLSEEIRVDFQIVNLGIENNEEAEK